MRRLLILTVILLSVSFGADDWGPLQFLVGNWTGDGGGQPGQGAGSFSFTPEVQGKVLLRKSFADYPAANGKAAYRHDDLMIIYRDGAAGLRAIYFDNEDHVIQYAVKTSGEGVVFQSEGLETIPRYRLTYTRAGADRLKLKFEIAPPGRSFATYIEADASRRR